MFHIFGIGAARAKRCRISVPAPPAMTSRPSFKLAAALCTALLLLAAARTLQAQQALPLEQAEVARVPCPIQVPESVAVQCGVVRVPEDYAAPGGRTIRLPYILLESPNADAAPDPLLFTEGGPGYSSLPAVWWLAASPLLQDRDIIILEQRGNRHTEPSLPCDRTVWNNDQNAETPCLDAIRAQGIDISQYNTHNIVRDIIGLRQALGVDEWNLYGTSFSTSLLLPVMAQDAAGVRSVILQSVKPPSETVFAHEADVPLRAIKQMFADCAADPSCAAAYPQLEAQFYDVVRSLNRDPVEVVVSDRRTGERMALTVDGDAFIDWIMIDSFYPPAFEPYPAAYLPLLIAELAHGNRAPLQSLAQNYRDRMIDNPEWSWGLFFAINCQQELPAAGDRPAADLEAGGMLDGFARASGQRAVCARWNLPALPPTATEPVRSDIPALVLAGAYDPVTPPSWSRDTAKHLPNSTYVEFAGYGHSVNMDNPCAAQLQVAFLNNPGAELDTSCVAGAARPAFVLPRDLYIAPGLANSGYDLSLGDPKGIPWLEAWAVASYLLMILILPVLLIGGAYRLLRRRGKGRDGTAIIAFLLALLVIAGALAIPVATTAVNAEYFERQVLPYALGPSRDFTAAALLAWLAPLSGLAILLLAAMTLWAWLRKRWTPGFRLVMTLLVAASGIIILLGLRWGLFAMLL